MGDGIAMLVWYFSLFYLLSGMGLAYLFLYLVRGIFPSAKWLQETHQKIFWVYPVSGSLFWLFQVYMAIFERDYLTTLVNEIPKYGYYVAMSVLSIVPLTGWFKKIRALRWIALGSNVLLVLVFIMHQTATFSIYDSYMLQQIIAPVVKSAVWYILLSFFLLSVALLVKKYKRK